MLAPIPIRQFDAGASVAALRLLVPAAVMLVAGVGLALLGYDMWRTVRSWLRLRTRRRRTAPAVVETDGVAAAGVERGRGGTVPAAERRRKEEGR